MIHEKTTFSYFFSTLLADSQNTLKERSLFLNLGYLTNHWISEKDLILIIVTTIKIKLMVPNNWHKVLSSGAKFDPELCFTLYTTLITEL